MSYDVPGLEWSGERMMPVFQSVEHLDIYDLRGCAYDLQLAIVTFGGLINRPRARVYFILGSEDQDWPKLALTTVPQTFSPLKGNDILAAFFASYRESVKGLNIYDPDLIDTVNVGTTLAGQRDGIVVSPALATELQATYNLPVLVDLRTYHWRSRLQAYQWAQEHLLPEASGRLIAGLNPQMVGLRSFLVATRTFVYWLDSRRYLPDSSVGLLSERGLMKQLYRHYPPGALHLGWFVDEPSGVVLTSRAGILVLASDFFYNLETWTAVQPASPPKIETRVERPLPALENNVYVSFTFSEGDNLQYCQHHLLKIWQDKARGTVPIGWTFSPLLLEIAPALVQYYRETATPEDEFIAGPSGAGYVYPSRLPESYLPQFLQDTARLMQAMGMTTIETLDVDMFYGAGLPLISKYSMNGMIFTHYKRQCQFMRALAPIGLRGILSGTGFPLYNGLWKKVEGLPFYENLGLAGTVPAAVKMIQRAARIHTRRPLFLNVYTLAWSMSPSQIVQVMEQLGDGYECVLPSTLLTLLEKTI